MSALSGFGKTQLLLELPQLLSSQSHWKFIHMTNCMEEKQLPSGQVFPWRVLCFYFCPHETWENFLKQTCDCGFEMTLALALQLVSNDIKRVFPTLQDQRVVITLTIDEFQLLADSPGRLEGVVASVASIMCSPDEGYICIPIFTGLFTQTFATAAKLSCM